MAVYRFEYAETRKLENGKYVNIPVEKWVYHRMDITTTDLNEAERIRYELCSSMPSGYVRIIEDYM